MTRDCEPSTNVLDLGFIEITPQRGWPILELREISKRERNYEYDELYVWIISRESYVVGRTEEMKGEWMKQRD